MDARVKADSSFVHLSCSCQGKDKTRQFFCEHAFAVAESAGALQAYLTGVVDHIKATKTSAYLEPLQPSGLLF